MRIILFLALCFVGLTSSIQAQTASSSNSEQEFLLQIPPIEKLFTLAQDKSFERLSPQSWEFATPEEIAQMTSMGWMPLVEFEVSEIIRCRWADGAGGIIVCPASAVRCRVVTAGGIAAIVCVDNNDNWVSDPTNNRNM